jgi:hypothetical protein
MLLPLLVLCIHCTAGLALDVKTGRINNDIVVEPIVNNALIELHIVTLTLQDDDPAANRREEEKRRLLHRMVRSKGCTDKNHARARLLTALHGFARCGDRNKADLQRWRDRYSHVPQHQKKVWGLEAVTMNW